MVSTGDVLLEFQRFIETHAKNVVNSLTVSFIKDSGADFLCDLEDKVNEFSKFYSDPLNWNSFDSKLDLTADSEETLNPAISDLIEVIINKYSNEFFQLCDEASASKKLIKSCNKNLRDIQQSVLQRVYQRRLSEKRRSISFGRIRRWTGDVMKSKRRSKSDISPAVAYGVAAKCARLKRRFSRLYILAQISHLLNMRLKSLDHPQIAAIQQSLMRSRLESLLNIKQNTSSQISIRQICDNPEAFTKRLENMSCELSAGVTHEAVRSRLDDLAENMTDLFVSLSQESSGLSAALGIRETLDRWAIKESVRQSLDGFCDFYVTSVAPNLASEKAEALLAQLHNPVEETEDLCPSDTEAMMDAFDVFDSFNEQTSPIASEMETGYEKEQEKSHQTSTLKDSTEQADEVISSAEIELELSSSQVDCGCQFVDPSTLRESTPRQSTSEIRPLFEGPSTPIETQPPLDNVELDFCDEEREEGEVVDGDDNAQNSSTDIDETEEVIMREWAPSNRPIMKKSYSESVEKTLNDAVKSCNRELSTVATLGVSDWESGFSKKIESQSLSSRINSAASQSQPPRGYSYNRIVMLRIRKYISAFLQRQRQSRQLYR